MESEISQFFTVLSERNWTENDLSDMLWSLLKTNLEFRRIFFNLIKSKHVDADISYVNEEYFVSVEREFTEKEINGRPDLRFLFAGEKELLLEVKKYDKNYHLTYDALFKDICILTHCRVKNEVPERWIKVTWRELYDNLKISEDNLIKAFADFIKGVFAMKDIKRVESFQIQNLYYLNSMIENALLEIKSENIFDVTINYKTKSFSSEGSGYHFDFRINSNQYLFPWIGVNYNDMAESKNPFGLMIWLNQYHQFHLLVNQKFTQMSSDKLKSIMPVNDTYHLNLKNNQVVIMPNCWNDDFLCKRTVDEQIYYIKNFLQAFLKLFQDILS